MRWSILLTIACGCSISGCHIETQGDCSGDEHCCRPAPWDGNRDLPGVDGGVWSTGTGGRGSGGNTHTAGTKSTGGDEGSGVAGGSGGNGSGGDVAGSGGSPEAGGARAMPCTVESDCARGYNCDTIRGECLPTDAETCPELTTEASCSVRKDCTTVYAGTNCTCGPDCQCTGGEPGCICERFEFFRCAAIQ